MAEHDFETVDSETVYVGNIFALRADDVRMPGGNIAKREVVEHYGAVAILAMWSMLYRPETTRSAATS